MVPWTPCLTLGLAFYLFVSLGSSSFFPSFSPPRLPDYSPPIFSQPSRPRLSLSSPFLCLPPSALGIPPGRGLLFWPGPWLHLWPWWPFHFQVMAPPMWPDARLGCAPLRGCRPNWHQQRWGRGVLEVRPGAGWERLPPLLRGCRRGWLACWVLGVPCCWGSPGSVAPR